jgi:acyl-CoA hydrolase
MRIGPHLFAHSQHSMLNWTGRSSMEITVVATQDGEKLAETEFLFVARNKQGTASIQVCVCARACVCVCVCVCVHL